MSTPSASTPNATPSAASYKIVATLDWVRKVVLARKSASSCCVWRSECSLNETSSDSMFSSSRVGSCISATVTSENAASRVASVTPVHPAAPTTEPSANRINATNSSHGRSRRCRHNEAAATPYSAALTNNQVALIQAASSPSNCHQLNVNAPSIAHMASELTRNV
jgi:thioester reductase-like protein